MKDTSIFQGVKEIGGFRFCSEGPRFWGVYGLNKEGTAFMFVGTINVLKNESNESLYQRALALSLL